MEFTSEAQERANAAYRIGGPKLHCEADEVAFRCRPVRNEYGAVTSIEWLRFIAVARRGSSKVWIEQLPARFSDGAGQGGGGPLSIAELDAVFRVDSDDPLLMPQSVLHTDSASSYKRMGRGFYKPAPGPLHTEDLTTRYSRHQYVHTAVCHKRRVGQPINYAVTRIIEHADGVQETCRAGTQVIDGFWTSLRRFVGRLGVKTGAPESDQRKRLLMLIRDFQWHWWHLHEDRFPLFGKLVQERRHEKAFAAMAEME